MRAVFAPGKMVLAGEYAVLDGGPALVAAVDQGVRCVVEPGPPGIETPDGDVRFVAPALEGAPPARYRFEAWPPLSLEGKPGFGGSAAACVAACLAAGRPGRDALAIHRQVQGGGSGIDVRASLRGGVLRVEGEAEEAVALPWPQVVFSGRSASTGPRVRQYLAWAEARPAERAAFLAASAEAVERMRQDPILGARQAGEALGWMSGEAGIDYMSEGLARILALARRHGGAAKPSGAGGGDIAVAWLPDPARARAFAEDCAAAGLPPLSVGPAGPAGPWTPPDGRRDDAGG